jgi:hypothetical protein
MIYSQTKPYYVQVTNTGSSNRNTSAILSAFTIEGIKLLELYAKKCVSDYFTEIETNFRQLKNTYPQYKYDDGANVISSFADAVYNLLTVNDALNDEIEMLRSKITTICNKEKINIKEAEHISQSASIKLVYLQYLLLYDLSLTNGIFIDVYLKEAEKMLQSNGGMLYHPTDFEKTKYNRELIRKKILYTNQKKIIIQDVSIKLVYIQYLLLFDLTLTNGLFLEKFLKEAESILKRNGGVLFHPKKVVDCDDDSD